ncbi:ATP-binding protein [Bacillus safensis]|uniref:ATP-binding protein n=1 Tax=Bacillus safensis TaxID=561879 RepID=UPI00065DC4C5|nr:ATP-binding protein [Bacillus safensis]
MHSIESEILLPDAAPLINSLRAIGYNFETAIADIVDNSIDAKASEIKIDIAWDSDKSYVRIEDNGFGMNEDELVLAMKVGSTNPNNKRKQGVLGRFGMGLKTASFSLGKRLTVLTKKEGLSFTRCWDLDYIEGTNKWNLLKSPFNSQSSGILHSVENVSGTVILIENLDRVVEEPYTRKKVQKFFNRIGVLEDHLAMVFHRFLKGPNKIQIYLNGNKIEPWDPFLSQEIATQELPPESQLIKDDIVKIQPYILPHHTKLIQTEYEKAAGPKGWLEQQGFYIYRNKRLLVAGSWLHLFGREESYKLARIKVDITNTSDFSWQIDIKKSSAKPPQELISILRKIGEMARKKSHEVFYQRSINKSPENKLINDYVWEQVSTKTHSYFRLNKNNSYLKDLLESNKEYEAKLKFYLFHVEEYCPANLVSFNINKPTAIRVQKITLEQKNKIKMLIDIFIDNNFSFDEIIKQLANYDSFSFNSIEELKDIVCEIIGGHCHYV